MSDQQEESIERKLDALLWLIEEIERGTGNSFSEIKHFIAERELQKLEKILDEKKFDETL